MGANDPNSGALYLLLFSGFFLISCGIIFEKIMKLVLFVPENPVIFVNFH